MAPSCHLSLTLTLLDAATTARSRLKATITLAVIWSAAPSVVDSLSAVVAWMRKTWLIFGKNTLMARLEMNEYMQHSFNVHQVYTRCTPKEVW